MTGPRDARAVENPLTASLDLADDVYDQTPKLRKMVRYAIIFIGVWWVIDLFLTIFLIVSPLFILGFMFLALLIIGLLALRMLFRTRDFLIYYEVRHRAIQTVRSANPETKIPDGKNAIERVLTYLRERSPDLRDAVRNGQLKVNGDATLRLYGGTYQYNMSAVAVRPSSLSWRLFDIGDRGYALYIKYFENAPPLNEIKAMEDAIVKHAAITGTPPSRVIIVMPSSAQDNLGDDVYDYITKNVIKNKVMFTDYYCSMQIISESSDGTYDFIPFMAD